MRLRGQGQRSCEHEGAILEGFRLSGGRSTGLELHGYLVGIAGKGDSVSGAHGTLGTNSAESTGTRSCGRGAPQCIKWRCGSGLE